MDSFYMIDVVHDRDDIDHLTGWKEKLYNFSPAFSILSLMAFYCYFAFRIKFTRAAQAATSETFITAWLFIFAEAIIACE
jgi:hypothetical protein